MTVPVAFSLPLHQFYPGWGQAAPWSCSIGFPAAFCTWILQILVATLGLVDLNTLPE